MKGINGIGMSIVNDMTRYLLDAWHSTTSASAEGVAFMEEDSHKRAAVGDGWH